MLFHEKLKELRVAKGFSQKELAAKIGAAQSAVAHWEAGNRVPAADSFQALCKALEVNCSVFDDCEWPKKKGKSSGG